MEVAHRVKYRFSICFVGAPKFKIITSNKLLAITSSDSNNNLKMGHGSARR